MLDGNVTHLQCLGGAPGSEGVLVACDDGQVLLAFINNPFPIPLWRHPDAKAIRAADVAGHRRTLAVVDADQRLSVVNLESGQVRSLRASSARW